MLAAGRHHLQNTQDDDGREQHRTGRGGGCQVRVPGLGDGKLGTGAIVVMLV